MCGALAVICGHGLLIEEGHLGFLLRLLEGSLFFLVELLERLFFLPPEDELTPRFFLAGRQYLDLASGLVQLSAGVFAEPRQALERRHTACGGRQFGLHPIREHIFRLLGSVFGPAERSRCILQPPAYHLRFVLAELQNAIK